MAGIGNNIQAQLAAKDEMIRSLQDQVTHWRQKYEALAKLYTQLRTEHLDLLSKQKQTALKANSAQESIDRMERMERDMKTKNLELADMIRERDRARFETDRLKSVRANSLNLLVYYIATKTEFNLFHHSLKKMSWKECAETFALPRSAPKTRSATRAPRLPVS